MIITTTPTIEGRKILEYKGVVSAEVILGANLAKDFFASFRDTFGGRVRSYERVLQEGRMTALQEMEADARAMGATAIVGVGFNIEVLGERGSILMVSVSGTTVVI